MTHTLSTRTLGSSAHGTALDVSALGLGCMGMSAFYGDPRRRRVDRHDPPRARARRHVLDTADMYGPFTNERARRPRDRGPARPGRARDQVRQRRSTPRRRPSAHRRHAPSTCAQAVDASLQRLGVDHIDLYYQHRVDPNVPIEETVGAMAELVHGRQGPPPRPLARPRPRRSAARTPSTRSPRCRPSTRCGRATSRTRSCRLLRELGIGLVPYSPARARLPHRRASRRRTTLADDDFRRHDPRFPGDEPSTPTPTLVDAVRELAEAKGITAGAARARVGARPGRRHRPDPRHQAVALPRGERRGRRGRAERVRPGRARRRGAA